MPDMSSIHAANVNYANSAQGSPGGFSPVHEQPASPPSMAGLSSADRAVIGDLKNLQNAHTPQTMQAAGARLINDLGSQENPKGQQILIGGVLSGKIRTNAQANAFVKMLSANAVAGKLGPVTAMVDKTLAQAAAQSGPGAAHAGMSESPASAVISSSTNAQNNAVQASQMPQAPSAAAAPAA